MAGSVKPHERKIATTLDFTNLLAVTTKLQCFELNFIVCLLTWPLKGFGPGLVAQPVADEVGVSLPKVSMMS